MLVQTRSKDEAASPVNSDMPRVFGRCRIVALARVIVQAPALLCLAVVMPLAAEAGGDVAQLCRTTGVDDTLQPVPQSLVPAAKRIFGLRMTDQQVRHSTVFRCASGQVLLCTYGANLPCGKANVDRHPAGATAWCRDHPDADFVPGFAIPSGNIYRWRCSRGASEILGEAEEVDPRGFIARFWKPLD